MITAIPTITYAFLTTVVLPFLDFMFPAHVHDLGPRFWYRFSKTFGLNWETLLSGPSPVQTEFSRAPIRTTVAALLQTPTRLELQLSGGHMEQAIWSFPGGWEVIYRNK